MGIHRHCAVVLDAVGVEEKVSLYNNCCFCLYISWREIVTSVRTMIFFALIFFYHSYSEKKINHLNWETIISYWVNLAFLEILSVWKWQIPISIFVKLLKITLNEKSMQIIWCFYKGEMIVISHNFLRWNFIFL